ncbi:cytochrome P450 2G1-like isoform X3 [Malurus melanocephalus]|uniref:cytochrome P450 2G1-like isoform X3 n=1 Tax=Malurus melanocephalus TaxID=175006 RepID=UPI002547AF60|nr:cytochrome P450 2G1-like isoform X3 [Malurus melanocephalus]
MSPVFLEGSPEAGAPHSLRDGVPVPSPVRPGQRSLRCHLRPPGATSAPFKPRGLSPGVSKRHHGSRPGGLAGPGGAAVTAVATSRDRRTAPAGPSSAAAAREPPAGVPVPHASVPAQGVVFSDGERWRQLRRFSLTVLRDFGMGKRSIESRIQEEAQELLQEFQKTQGKAFDPTFLLSCAVSNIICSIVFGSRFDYHDPEFLEMMQLINNSFREMSTPWSQLYDMAESLLRFMPGPHRRIPRLLARMRRFIARRVQDNARTLDSHSPRDFIDAFLIQMEKEKDNPNSEFTMENLELTTLNLFFAGTETVSSTLRFGFLYLMRHPHIEEKVFKEISAVVGSGRAPAIADRSQMPFTEATIHEIQRCSDLIPMNVPHRVTRDTEFRGFLIPRGTDVYPLLSSVLNDAKSFKNPQNFDPGNFLDEKGQFQRNEAFLPFSAGKRLCLGEGLARMELFLFFTTILQNLRLQPLGHPEGVPTTPLESGFANIAPRYELRMLPR